MVSIYLDYFQIKKKPFQIIKQRILWYTVRKSLLFLLIYELTVRYSECTVKMKRRKNNHRLEMFGQMFFLHAKLEVRSSDC